MMSIFNRNIDFKFIRFLSSKTSSAFSFKSIVSFPPRVFHIITLEVGDS